MPIKTGARQEMDPRDTFRMSTPDLEVRSNMTATPVEHFENRHSGAISEFVQAAKEAVNTGFKGELLRKQTDQRKAEVDFMSGEIENDQSRYYRWKIEHLQGAETASSDFKMDMDELIRNAKAHDRDWYYEQKGRIIQQYFNSESKAYKSGFLKQAKPLEVEYDRKQQELERVFVRNTRATGMRNKIIADLEAGLTSSLKGEDLDKFLRELSLKEAEAYGDTFSKTEFMAHMIDALNLYGLEEGGRPELFNWAFIQVDGIAPVDNPELANRITAARTSNEMRRDQLEAKAEREASKVVNDIWDVMTKSLVTAIYDGDTAKVNDLTKAAREMGQSEYISGAQLNSVLSAAHRYNKALQERSKVGGTSDQYSFALALSVVNSDAPVQDKLEALNKIQLSDAQYIRFADRITQDAHEKRTGEWAGVDIGADQKETFKTVLDIAKKGIQGGVYDTEKEAYDQVNNSFQIGWKSYYLKEFGKRLNSGKPPSAEEVQKAAQLFIDEISEEAGVPSKKIFLQTGQKRLNRIQENLKLLIEKEKLE